MNSRASITVPVGGLMLVLAFSAMSSAATVDSVTRCDTLVMKEIAASCGPFAMPSDLSARLGGFARWLGEKETPCSAMVAGVAERRNTLLDTVHHPIDTSMVTFVGMPDAPVFIIMYISATCPMCKRIYNELYDSVVTGSLKGTARLGFKPFSSRPWDVALLASRNFGRQADLMRSLAGVTERISLAIILKKADSIGIPRKEFRKAIDDPRMVSRAEASYKEGAKNGVRLVPTLFINGIRYKSYKDPRWVIDAAEYYCGQGSRKNGGENR